jgi:hypothetical protein
MKPKTAEAAVDLALDWITSLFQDTTPEQFIDFLRIRDQTELYDKLAEFVAPHVAKGLDLFMNTPERKLLAQFSRQLMMQFLTQAFCQYDDDIYLPTGSRHSNFVHTMLRDKLRPYWEEFERRRLEKLKVEQSAILKKRAAQYKSPDVRKEVLADLSAAENESFVGI